MLPEISLLKYILVYKYFNKYYRYININKYNYKELSVIYATLPKFFAKHGEQDASLDAFVLFFFGLYPRLKPEEANAYRNIFEQASKADLTDAQVDAYVATAARRYLAAECAAALLQYSEGTIEESKLKETLGSFDAEADAPASKPSYTVVTHDIEELLHATYEKPGFRWRLGCLNRSLGSLRSGNFGFIFARPETGKTTFLASEVTHFASQTDRPICWFNNEGDGKVIGTRIFQAACGIPLETYYSNSDRYKQMYKDLVGDRIKLIDEPMMHKTMIEEAIKDFQPALVVIDQLDKVHGFEAERNDLVLGYKYQWARKLAVKCPVIGICQADGTGEGVKWLSMNHVADAKTAKQAEADFILGIGKTHDMEELEHIRYLNISKNKMFGDKESDPKLRHGQLLAEIQPELARYRDLGD